MASGVNVKMGVSGVAQFKQNMNQAKQAVKTLDAQLSLTEKQFKASGDAESYMTEKAELLKAKLESQKNVLANAEKALADMAKNGIDKSSKAYQDMYRQMVQAKGEILDTESALKNVATAGEDAADGASEMNNQLKRIGDGVNFENVTSGLGKVTGGLESAAKKAINLGRKIFDAMMGAGSYADDLKTRAAQYGLTTDQLQRMDKTANLIDTSVEAIIGSQRKLKKGIGSADKGVMGAFAELLGEGYDPKKTGWENAFWDAGEAIMKFSDEEEKEVYAQKLFGKSWSELIPLFEAGREEYEKTNESWNVLSEDQINSLGKMDDEYQKVQDNFETLKNTALAEFAEPMASLLETINTKLGEFTEWLQSEEGREAVNNVVGTVKDALEWMVNNSDTVLKFIEGFGIAWAGLKLVEGFTSVLELVNGLKGLTASSAASAGSAAGSSWAGAFAEAAMKAAPFLAFLYTLLNPSGGGDKVGNNDLLDANGNLTNEAKEYGYTLDKDGNLVPGEVPEKYTRQEPEAKLKNWQERYLESVNRNQPAAADPNDWRPSYMRGLDRMTEVLEETNQTNQQANQNSITPTDLHRFYGMPAAVAEAVSKVGFTIELEGQQLIAYIDAHMGNRTMDQ